MKKNILKVILFFTLLIVVAVFTFEIAFRFGNADLFISLLGHLSFLGFKQSFDSLFIFLLILSLLIASLLCYCLTTFINKKKAK